MRTPSPVVDEIARRHSLVTPGGYAAVAVSAREGPVTVGAFLQGERLEAPRRSSIASLTKPITAVAVMQLAEAGDVTLDEPIAAYVPEFVPQPPAGKATATPVTARHILSHTSGLSDLPDIELRRRRPTLTAMLDAVCHQRLRFEPGAAYAYASDPWYLLSALIERVSGTPYPEYLRERILSPLGMDATTFDPRDPGPEALPPEGSFVIDDLTPAEVVAAMAGLSMPGGGLWSIPEDVATFGRAMLLGGGLDGSRIIGRESVARMTRLETGGLGTFGTDEPARYALGWSLPGLGPSPTASESAFGHGGATGSALVVDPDNDLVVVYLRNWWGVSSDLADEALAAIYDSLSQ